MNKIVKLDKTIHAYQTENDLPHMGWGDTMAQVPDFGIVLEFGVYVGDSFKAICRCVSPRTVYGFDWFRGLPKPWEDVYTGADYPEGQERIIDLKGEIKFAVPGNGVLIVGLVEDTLEPFLENHFDAVAFTHFDMDIYEPTKFALEQLTSRFRTGTILVFDEIDKDLRNINNEQRAFREWLEACEFDFDILGRRHGESWVVRLI